MIQSGTVTSGLLRESPLTIANAWSVFCQVKPVAPVAFGNTFWLYGDPTYAAPYIWIGHLATGQLVIETFDGVTTQDLIVVGGVTDGVTAPLALTYTPASHVLTLYANNISVGTITLNLGAVVFTVTQEYLLTDDDGGGSVAGTSVGYLREWSATRTAAEFVAETSSITPVITSGLVSDTPLQTSIDLTAHNNTLTQWTAIGTVTTDTADPLVSVTAGPPTNTSPSTALLIDADSAVFLDTLTAGAATTVWCKAVATMTVHGIAGFGDLVTYNPKVTVYDGLTNANNNTPIPNFGTPVVNGPVQFPATVGHTYYFKLERNGAVTPATIQVSFLDALDLEVPRGSIAVNDVNDQFPLALLDAATCYPIKFVSPFPAGEQGLVLPNGVVCVHDSTADTLNIYSIAYALVASVDVSALAGMTLGSNNADKWYVGDNGGAGDATVRTLSQAGVLSAVLWTLTGSATVTILAVNADDTILYYLDSGAVNQPIKRWDLVNDVALANLVAGIANYAVTHEILVLTDGTLIVRYIKNTVTKDQKILHYSAAGAVLGTYTYGSDFGTLDDRICTAPDDPISFLFWVRPLTLATAGQSLMKTITVSTMAVASSVPGPMFDNGITDAAITTNTPARWGFSESCPFWVTRRTPAPPPVAVRDPIRRLRTFPLPFDRNFWIYIRRLEFEIEAGVGLANDAGTDPLLEVRVSSDGGNTWGDIMFIPMGPRGQYALRQVLNNIGRVQNGYIEVVDSDPVRSDLLACFVDIEENET